MLHTILLIFISVVLVLIFIGIIIALVKLVNSKFDPLQILEKIIKTLIGHGKERE